MSTFADEWIILTSTDDDAIIGEITMLNQMLAEPLGRRTSLKAKTAENLTLLIEMLRDEQLSNIFDPEDEECEGRPPIVIERCVKFQKIGAIEYMEYAKE